VAGKFKHGIRKTNERAPDGRVLFDLRITAPNPDKPGKKLVDSIRTVPAKSTADAAKQREELIKSEVAKKQGRLRSHQPRTFAAVADEYIASIERYGTRTSWGSYAKKLKAEFGEMKLDKIQTAHMQRYIASMAGQFSRSTVKGLQQVLLRVFEHGELHGDLTGENRSLGVKLPKPKRSASATLARLEGEALPKRSLDELELPAFMAAFRAQYPDLYTLVLVMVATGGRFSEISALQRKDIDLRTGAMVIKRAQVAGRVGPPKKDRSRAAAIPYTALVELHAHLRRMDELKWPGYEEWVFPPYPLRTRKFATVWSRSTVGGAMKATMKSLGIATTNATHVARHTLNGLIRGHVTDSVLRSVVGHADEAQSVAYGDPAVLAFAAQVDRVLLGAGGSDDVKTPSEQESQ
jgi:integrase